MDDVRHRRGREEQATLHWQEETQSPAPFQRCFGMLLHARLFPCGQFDASDWGRHCRLSVAGAHIGRQSLCALDLLNPESFQSSIKWQDGDPLRSSDRANLKLFTHLRKDIVVLQVGTGSTPEC